jgi:hypothetical protein
MWVVPSWPKSRKAVKQHAHHVDAMGLIDEKKEIFLDEFGLVEEPGEPREVALVDEELFSLSHENSIAAQDNILPKCSV